MSHDIETMLKNRDHASEAASAPRDGAPEANHGHHPKSSSHENQLALIALFLQRP
jgi:hypothetical protein